MVERVILKRSGLTTSRIGLGTSRLHHMGRSARERLLETAVDAGVTHIDTAPLYGDTLAEKEIGRILGPKRDRVVIASKYGIPASRVIAAAAMFGQPLRAGRAIARKAGLLRQKRNVMTVEGMRNSVEQSLRHLRTDRLDIFLLHEPSPATLTESSEIYAELLQLQQKGHIRYFGLAGAWEGITALGECITSLGEVVQTNEYEWSGSYPPDITYSAIADGPRSVLEARATSDAAIDRLRRAMARRPQGTVLVSTTKPDRLAALVEGGSKRQ